MFPIQRDFIYAICLYFCCTQKNFDYQRNIKIKKDVKITKKINSQKWQVLLYHRHDVYIDNAMRVTLAVVKGALLSLIDRQKNRQAGRQTDGQTDGKTEVLTQHTEGDIGSGYRCPVITDSITDVHGIVLLFGHGHSDRGPRGEPSVTPRGVHRVTVSGDDLPPAVPGYHSLGVAEGRLTSQGHLLSSLDWSTSSSYWSWLWRNCNKESRNNTIASLLDCKVLREKSIR